MCNVGNVLVVDHDDTDRVNQLMNEQRVRQVYTPQRIVNFIASAHGGAEDSGLQISALNGAAGQILGGGGAADVEEVCGLLLACITQEEADWLDIQYCVLS